MSNEQLVASYYQTRLLNGSSKKLALEFSEDIPYLPDEIKVGRWSLLNLCNWMVSADILKLSPRFDRRCPIFVDIIWAEKIILRLVMVRNPKSRLRGIWRKLSYRSDGNLYVLVPKSIFESSRSFKETPKHDSPV
jgi:hypothetical protein